MSPTEDRKMRTPNVSIMYDTLGMCFDEAIEILGAGIKDTIYYHLARKHIQKPEIGVKFQEVENTLEFLFGQGAKSVMVLTLERLCEQYSLPLRLEYASSLTERLQQVIEKILVDKLVPKHDRKRLDSDKYEDKLGSYAPWTD